MTTLKLFVKFTEDNEHEGEMWRFYIRCAGNEEELLKLKALIDTEEEEEEEQEQYTINLERRYTEEEVDLFVEECNDNRHLYMREHTKLDGTFQCPKETDSLYKGGIVELVNTECK